MNDDLQWNREGKLPGVISSERIATGRNKRRGKTGVLGSGMELGEMVFFF